MKKRMLFGLGIIIVFAVSLISPVLASAPETEAWYTLRLNPFSDIIHINSNAGGWLNGYDEAYPGEGAVIGKGEGNTAIIVIDLPAGGYEMLLMVITISTRDGYAMRISDDYSLTGPEYVWLTSAATTESAEGPTIDEATGSLASSLVTPAAWYTLTLHLGSMDGKSPIHLTRRFSDTVPQVNSTSLQTSQTVYTATNSHSTQEP